MIRCNQCKKAFPNSNAFEKHGCVTEAMKLPMETLIALFDAERAAEKRALWSDHATSDPEA